MTPLRNRYPPRPSGCSEHHPSRPGAVGPDGVLYFPTILCGALGVAISRDEGTTWRFRSIVASGLQDIYTAGTALDALREANIRVPDDLALISFDNVSQSSHTSPPLTTVDVYKREMGAIAIDILQSRLHRCRLRTDFAEVDRGRIDCGCIESLRRENGNRDDALAF